VAVCCSACGVLGAEGGSGGTTTSTLGPILTTTAPDLTTTTTEPAVLYVVQPGDTIGQVATEHGLTADRLTSFNGITLDTPLRIGQEILIPLSETPAPPPAAATTAPAAPGPGAVPPGGATPTTAAAPTTTAAGQVRVVEAGESLPLIAAALGIPLEALLAANGLQADSMIHPGQELVVPTPAAPAGGGAGGDGQ
jgi:LysM repeat protein